MGKVGTILDILWKKVVIIFVYNGKKMILNKKKGILIHNRKENFGTLTI